MDHPANPFQSLRHVASNAFLPLCAGWLVVVLALLSPVVWSWLVPTAWAVSIVLAARLGRSLVERQRRKENPRCQTQPERSYMTFVFTCTVEGLLSLAALVALVVGGKIVFYPAALLFALPVALLLSWLGCCLIWRYVGKQYESLDVPK